MKGIFKKSITNNWKNCTCFCTLQICIFYKKVIDWHVFFVIVDALFVAFLFEIVIKLDCISMINLVNGICLQMQFISNGNPKDLYVFFFFLLPWFQQVFCSVVAYLSIATRRTLSGLFPSKWTVFYLIYSLTAYSWSYISPIILDLWSIKLLVLIFGIPTIFC